MVSRVKPFFLILLLQCALCISVSHVPCGEAIWFECFATMYQGNVATINLLISIVSDLQLKLGH